MEVESLNKENQVKFKDMSSGPVKSKTVFLAIFNTFRSFVAIGILTLPYAVK